MKVTNLFNSFAKKYASVKNTLATYSENLGDRIAAKINPKILTLTSVLSESGHPDSDMRFEEDQRFADTEMASAKKIRFPETEKREVVYLVGDFSRIDVKMDPSSVITKADDKARGLKCRIVEADNKIYVLLKKPKDIIHQQILANLANHHMLEDGQTVILGRNERFKVKAKQALPVLTDAMGKDIDQSAVIMDQKAAKALLARPASDVPQIKTISLEEANAYISASKEPAPEADILPVGEVSVEATATEEIPANEREIYKMFDEKIETISLDFSDLAAGPDHESVPPVKALKPAPKRILEYGQTNFLGEKQPDADFKLTFKELAL